VKFAWLALLLTLPATASAAKLTLSGGELRLEETEATEAGLRVVVSVRDLCRAEIAGEEVELPCSPWRPLESEGPSRKLIHRGEVTLPSGTKKPANLRGGAVDGDVFSLGLRLLPPKGLEAARPWPATDAGDGAWTLGPERLGEALLLGGELGSVGAWGFELSGLNGELPLGGEAPTFEVAGDDARPFASPWRCAALGDEEALVAHLEAGTPLDRLIQEANGSAGACAERSELAVEALCRQSARVEYALSRAGGLDGMLAAQLDVRALARSCESGVLDGLRKAGSLAREFLVTTQEPAGLVEFVATYQDLLGEEWGADSAELAADLVLAESRKDGSHAAIESFLTKFPGHAREAELTAALLENTGRLLLPCEGGRRRCRNLPAGAVVEARWADPDGRPARASLVGWGSDGPLDLGELYGAWAEGARPDELQSLLAGFEGEQESGRFRLRLPVPLKRTPDPRQTGFAVRLEVEGGVAHLPFSVEETLKPFSARTRLLLLRAGAVDRQDAPDAELVRAASMGINSEGFVIQGSQVVTWTGWSDRDGLVGPQDPVSLVRLDLLDVGVDTLLRDAPVERAWGVGSHLLARVGAACSEATASVAMAGALEEREGCQLLHFPPLGDSRAVDGIEDGWVEAAARNGAVAVVTNGRRRWIWRPGSATPLALSPGAEAAQLALSPGGESLAVLMPGGALEVRSATDGLVLSAGAAPDCSAPTQCSLQWSGERPRWSCVTADGPSAECGPFEWSDTGPAPLDPAGGPLDGLGRLHEERRGGDRVLVDPDGDEPRVIASNAEAKRKWTANCSGSPAGGFVVQRLGEGKELVWHRLVQCTEGGFDGPVELVLGDARHRLTEHAPGLPADAESPWAEDWALALTEDGTLIGADGTTAAAPGVVRALWYRPPLDLGFR